MAFLLISVLVIMICVMVRTALRGRGVSGSAPLYPEANNVVSFDDTKINVKYWDGTMRSMHWADLTMVGIRTTDEGPFAADVFWCLHASDAVPVIVYPQGATGDQDLLQELQRRLVGFDNRKLIEAMGCTDNAHFTVWSKAAHADEKLSTAIKTY